MLKIKFNSNIIRRKVPELLISIARILFLGIVGYIVLYPLLYMFVSSIKDMDALLDMEHIWVPISFSFNAFTEINELLGFGNALKQTLLVQVLSAAIEVFVCFMCDSESISSEKTFPLSIAEFSSASNSARLVSEYSDSCFLTRFLSTLSKFHSCSTERKKSGSLQKSI